MRYLLIVNPTAGGGRATSLAKRLVTELASRGVEPEIVWTTDSGHARELGRTADTDVDVVVAVGGDGTVHAVASGLIAAGGTRPLGVAPFGSGNDFARIINMPRTPDAVAEALADGRVCDLDYGILEWEGPAGGGSDVFVNALGCGFDAFVADEVRHTRHWKGHLRYLVTVFRCLRRWHDPAATVEVDGPEGARMWAAPLLLATAGIGTSSGGGFLLTPRASAVDGLFDVCIARSMPLHRILYVLPLALMGRHLSAREITYHRSGEFLLRSAETVPVHLDGEVIPGPVHKARARIVPRGLRVLTAAGAPEEDSAPGR